jgi:hypothetical protein
MILQSFRLELGERITADGWRLSGPVRLRDAWRLLSFEKLLEIGEQACRDYIGGGYSLPRSDDRKRYVVTYRWSDLWRHGDEAVLQALCEGELLAEGFAHNAPLDGPRSWIAAQRWDAIDVDWEAGEAGPIGARITGIMVHHARDLCAELSGETATTTSRPPPTPQDQIIAFLEALLKKDPHLSIEQAQEAIAGYFGWAARREGVRTACQALGIKQTAGRPRRSRSP